MKFALKSLTFALSLSFAAGAAWAEGITILHVGDQETWLLSAQGSLRDSASQGISFYGGIDRLATVMTNRRAEAAANNRFVLSLNAGDAILPGPRLNASFANLGTAYLGGQDFYDTIATRHIGFDAIVFGNHEFDLGPAVAARFAEVSGATYLSANIDFNVTPQFAALAAAGKIAPSKIVTTPGGKKIALVGATTPLLPKISSPAPGTLIGYDANASDADNLDALVPILQAEIDRVRNVEGATVVILMSHLQNVNNERNVIVPQLRGVDLVVSGGGHELMVDPDDQVIPGGVAPSFNQDPIYATDADGKSVAIVTAHFGNRYVGELNVTIDDATGKLTSIDSSKMIRVSGAAADADRVTGDATLAAQVIAPVQAYVAALNAQVIGKTDVKLNGPTHTSCTPAPCTFTAGVRNAETGLGNLVADAMRFAGNADVAIQNGGGIRTSIGAPGNVTVGNTFDILPFTNLVKRAPAMNAAQLKDLLEHSVATASPTGAVNGRFAQVAGIRVEYDTTRTPRGSSVGSGDRVRRIVMDDGTVLVDNGAVVSAREFAFATIDFTANGGDGYPFAANGVMFENNPFSITYQQALADYIATPKAQGGLKRDSAADGSEITANLYGVENQYDMGGRLVDLAIATSMPGVMRTGTAGRDALVGTDGDDMITGGPGADTLTGGKGNDVFVYASMRDAGDTIADFTPYADRLELRPLLASLGCVTTLGCDAARDGWVRAIDVTGGIRLEIDADGAAGPAIFRPLATLKGLTAKQFAPARDLMQ